MEIVLLPETVAFEDGAGPEVTLGPERGKALMLTLNVTQVIEQESLDISIWGSADRENWRQLATYPQKSYCGTYLMLLDFARHDQIRFVRAQWRMSRWGVGDPAVLAGFQLSAEVAPRRAATAA